MPWGLDFIFYSFLYFTIEKDRERSRNMGRLLTSNQSDLNLCELGRISAAKPLQQADSPYPGKLSAPTKRSSSVQEHL